MNEERLWLAIGNAEDRYIIAAESFEQKKAKTLHLLLAAAIILALSVSAAATVRYRTSIKDIWKNDTLSADTASVLEDAAVNIDGSDVGSGMEARITEAPADEKNIYLVWQPENYEEPFPDGTRESISFDFGDITVDSAMGYIGGSIDADENILSGYVLTDWNKIMQSIGRTITLSNLDAPQEVPSGEEYLPNWFELFERCEYIGFPEIEYIKGSSLWPREYFPQYGRLEIAIDDSGM